MFFFVSHCISHSEHLSSSTSIEFINFRMLLLTQIWNCFLHEWFFISHSHQHSILQQWNKKKDYFMCSTEWVYHLSTTYYVQPQNSVLVHASQQLNVLCISFDSSDLVSISFFDQELFVPFRNHCNLNFSTFFNAIETLPAVIANKKYLFNSSKA